MTDTPIPPAEPEASHLIVQPYDDADREDPPEWYDDTINVGDTSNEESD